MIRINQSLRSGRPLPRIESDTDAGRQTGRQADRQAGRQADRQTGRQADRQVDKQVGEDRRQNQTTTALEPDDCYQNDDTTNDSIDRSIKLN